jgi:hypothetical protein
MEVLQRHYLIQHHLNVESFDLIPNQMHLIVLAVCVIDKKILLPALQLRITVKSFFCLRDSTVVECNYKRLNMELDLQCLFGLLCTAVLIG